MIGAFSHLVMTTGRNCPILERLKNLGWIVAFVGLCAIWGYEITSASRQSRPTQVFGFALFLGNVVPLGPPHLAASRA
jgi:hypothetical protein